MKKIILIFFIFAFLPLLSYTQYTQFQVSIGGTETDVAHSIVQTTDGGYAVAGYTWSFGAGSNAYIIKLDASGMIQWTRTLGGTGWDDITSIVQTIDGGYIAAGSSIFKLDKNGTLQWCENISGESWSIIQTSDSGYTIAGKTNSFGIGDYDMFIVRLDSSGSLQWARTVGGIGYDFGSSIIQTIDGGYTLTGSYTVYGVGSYILVVKLNSSGTLEWAKTIGEGYEEGYAIIQTIDGGYAVVGKADINTGRTPFYIVKLSGEGTLQWTSTISLRDGDIANSIIQTSDGGYAVAGYTRYIEGYPDWLIVKLDSMGMLDWSRVIIGGTEAGNEAFSIIKTIDGGYVVAGVKDSFEPAGDMYIVKYHSSWNTCSSNDSLVSSTSGTWGTISTVTPIVTSPSGFITPRTPTIGSGGIATIICVTGIQPVSNKVPVSFKLK